MRMRSICGGERRGHGNNEDGDGDINDDAYGLKGSAISSFLDLTIFTMTLISIDAFSSSEITTTKKTLRINIQNKTSHTIPECHTVPDMVYVATVRCSSVNSRQHICVVCTHLRCIGIIIGTRLYGIGESRTRPGFIHIDRRKHCRMQRSFLLSASKLLNQSSTPFTISDSSRFLTIHSGSEKLMRW